MINNIIPIPKKIEYNYQQFFRFCNDVCIRNLEDEILKSNLVNIVNDKNMEIAHDAKNIINFRDSSSIIADGFKISISNRLIEISTSNYSGKLYAINALKILFHDNEEYLSGCIIEDYPDYGFRQLLIDPARHMIPIKDIKKTIRTMAQYRLNVLQIHLTDDNGWRIESKKFPKLNEVGSYVQKTSPSYPVFIKQEFDYNGYYKISELKDLVLYAKMYGVDILPEIDVPGHSQALVLSYPECGCHCLDEDGKKVGPMDNGNLCIGGGIAIETLKEVISEIIDIFPYEYFHIGADEVRHKHYKYCPSCTEFMKEKGYTNTVSLQTYFVNELSAFIKEKNKKPIVWNDATLDSDCTNGLTVTYWDPSLQSHSDIKRVSKKGNKVIDMNSGVHYLDYFVVCNSVEKIFNYQSPFSLEDSLGTGGALWGEQIMNSDQLNRMLYPRIIAVAERAWNYNKVDSFDNFISKIESNKWYLQSENIATKNYWYVTIEQEHYITQRMYKRWGGSYTYPYEQYLKDNGEK